MVFREFFFHNILTGSYVVPTISLMRPNRVDEFGSLIYAIWTLHDNDNLVKFGYDISTNFDDVGIKHFHFIRKRKKRTLHHVARKNRHLKLARAWKIRMVLLYRFQRITFHGKVYEYLSGFSLHCFLRPCPFYVKHQDVRRKFQQKVVMSLLKMKI